MGHVWQDWSPVTDETDRREDDMDTIQATYRILAENESTLLKLVTRLNKKAAKLGVDPILMVSGRPYDVPNEDGRTIDTFVDVTITGTAPKLNGWQFVATLQHEEEANILRVVPTWEGVLPEEFRISNPSRCDHCMKFRRRNDTYVLSSIVPKVTNPDETFRTFMQVGSSCLKDFLGHKNPHAVAAQAEWMSLIGEAADTLGSNGMRNPTKLVLITSLAWAAESVIRNGWVSKAKAEELGKIATADDARTQMDIESRGRKPDYTPSEAAYTLAETAIEWGREWVETQLAKNDENDYCWNLRVCLAGDTINVRSFALAASVIGVYQRQMERLAKERAAAAGKVSEWVGQVGDKLTLDLTIDSVRYLDGQFGTTSLITYHDEAGRVFTWFGSGYKEVEVGKQITVKGTVKKLDEFRGVRQTVLTRVKEA